MDKQMETLLTHLETEGRHIAKCRKSLCDYVHTSRTIDCSQILLLCNRLNEYISSFDRLHEQLTELENLQ